MIVFISCTGTESNPYPMVRICPACHQQSVIGHGWRNRQAHDATHTWIRVHRGICKLCSVTLTMLPDWLIPNGHYSLAARQQAGELAEQQDRTLEDCVPHCADPDRLADSRTIQRWFQRRTESLILCVLLWLPQPPTLLAWDWKATSRILATETNSS